jgi:FkbM family methyltransferase
MSGAVKRLVRRAVESQGFEIVPQTSENGPVADTLGLLIELCQLKHGDGSVVQIGANDGVMGDPVRNTILRLGLPALLVEPLPDLFTRLKENYAGVPRLEFANVAISTEEGEATIFRISAEATHLPAWAHGLASFDKSVLLRHRDWPGAGPDFADWIQEVNVPVVTLRQLLDRHPGVARVLALQVDTEGHDFTVIRSAIEAGCRPPLINYEHKHLARSDQAACRDLLAENGYAFHSGRVDTIAIRNDLTDS